MLKVLPEELCNSLEELGQEVAACSVTVRRADVVQCKLTIGEPLQNANYA